MVKEHLNEAYVKEVPSHTSFSPSKALIFHQQRCSSTDGIPTTSFEVKSHPRVIIRV